MVGALAYLPMANAEEVLAEKKEAPKEEVKVEPKVEEAAAKAPKVKVSGLLAQIVAEGQKPTTRTQVIIKNLPYNTDGFITAQHQGSNDFYKFRTQTAPLKYDIVSLGGILQHVDGTEFDAHQEAGILLRLSGNPTENSFAKSDFRYFPTRGDLGGKMLFDSEKVFADLLWNYNFNTDNAFFRPGVEYKLGKNVLLGLEGKVSGEIKDMKTDYVGLRGTARF